jgi:hypothetical protein
MTLTEDPDQVSTPIQEEALEVPAHEQFVGETTTRYGVVNVIARDRLCAVVGNGVLVHPVTEGSAALLVDESTGWLPGGDLALPVDGHAMNAEAVVDASPHAHVDRAGREQPQPEPRRDDGLEVVDVRDEAEDVLDRVGQENCDRESKRSVSLAPDLDRRSGSGQRRAHILCAVPHAPGSHPLCADEQHH